MKASDIDNFFFNQDRESRTGSGANSYLMKNGNSKQGSRQKMNFGVRVGNRPPGPSDMLNRTGPIKVNSKIGGINFMGTNQNVPQPSLLNSHAPST